MKAIEMREVKQETKNNERKIVFKKEAKKKEEKKYENVLLKVILRALEFSSRIYADLRT